jgi:hypothetical protein
MAFWHSSTAAMHQCNITQSEVIHMCSVRVCSKVFLFCHMLSLSHAGVDYIVCVCSKVFLFCHMLSLSHAGVDYIKRAATAHTCFCSSTFIVHSIYKSIYACAVCTVGTIALRYIAAQLSLFLSGCVSPD